MRFSSLPSELYLLTGSVERTCFLKNIITKYLFIKLFLTLFVAEINAMSWSIENKKKEMFEISFLPDERGIDIIISCDQNAFHSLHADLQKGFYKYDGKFFHSKLNHAPKLELEEESEARISKYQRLVCIGKSKSVSITELSEIIKTKRVIFYTGAGISAGTVPVMKELEHDLGISETLKDGDNLQKYVSDLLRNPSYYEGILSNFFDKCSNSKPTESHIELAKIITKYGHILVTENVDQLHQKTDLNTLIFAGHDTYSDVLSDKIKNIDFIITIGLNSDESGFLKWYKDNNWSGRIISINLVDTNYLSDDDFSIKGDAQQIIKQLGELI